jgi:RNA methyltransferase, TrmH family
MLSKARIKFIKSLQLKKYRKQEQCFVVQGEKSVLETLQSHLHVQQILATPDFMERNEKALSYFKGEVLRVKANELALLGEYASNDAALAIVTIPPNEFKKPTTGFSVMLDDIRDPGNLGTIIRTADWYGIDTVIASEETADVYNHKVIQSSMGSFTRVKVFYTNVVEYLSTNKQPVYGTFLQGENVHAVSFGAEGIIVVGNEANGISAAVEKFVTNRITIPAFGKAESLNAAIATGIVLDNLRRR